jgi:hypothetical protein
MLLLLTCSCFFNLHVWVSVIAIGTASILGEWLFLASLFIVCCLLLLDATLQGSGPAPALGPFGSS